MNAVIGFAEIVVCDDVGIVVAIITHPCVGAAWFVHRVGSLSGRGKKFRTKRAAINAAEKTARG